MENISLRHTANGSFSPAEHLEFVRNVRRITAFKTAFERSASGRTVLDVGTGSGLMAILAARAGAKKIIAIEKDERMAKIARANFERNGLGNRIRLITGDALDLARSDLNSVDILVGELLSTWCVVESQVPVFRNILNLADEPLITIPKRIINYAEGVNALFGDEDGLVIIPTTYFEFESTRPKAEKLTARVKASEITFSADASLDAVVHIALRALRPGIINALRLTSITETCYGVTFGSTDDTMPRMIVPLLHEIALERGELVRLALCYTYGAGWGSFSISLL